MGDVAPLRPSGGRVPPHDLDAEGAVLSAILLDPPALFDVQQILVESDFYADANRLIFRAIEALDRSGSAYDSVTVAAWLRAQNLLERIGGTPYLAQIQEATPAVANVVEHARIVAGKSYQRRVVAMCLRYAAEGYEAMDDPMAWGQKLEADVFAASRGSGTSVDDNTLPVVVPRVYHELEKRRRGEADAPGVPTGWRCIDEALGGWRSKVYVVAGRPGMGKSAFVAQACAQVAEQCIDGRQYASVLVSLEMNRDELVTRLISQWSGIPFKGIDRQNAYEQLSLEDWDKVGVYTEALRKIPMSIVYAPGATVARVRTIVRQEMSRLRRQFGEELKLGLIGLDYVQIMNGERQRGESRDTELSRLCKELQWLTGEFDCALMEAAQLNRSADTNPDKRPKLSNLRESGAIEQEAFAVMFPFRAAYYDDVKKNDRTQDCEIIVGKYRNGPGPTIYTTFVADCMRFDDDGRSAT